MKYTSLILFFTLISICAFSQEFYVTFADGKNTTQRSYFQCVDTLPVHIPLILVAKKSTEIKGTEYIQQQTKLTRPFNVVFSDSLYNLYSGNSAFTFLYFNKNSTPEHKFGIEKLKTMPELYNALAPISAFRATLYKITEKNYYRPVNLYYYNSTFYVHYFYSFLTVNLKTRASNFYQLADCDYIYKKLFSDTLQYYYAKKQINATQNIPILHSIAANDSFAFFNMHTPVFSKIENALNVDYQWHLFSFNNDTLSPVIRSDEYILKDFQKSTEKMLIATGDTLMFLYQDNMSRENELFGFCVQNDSTMFLGNLYTFPTPENSKIQSTAGAATEIFSVIYSDSCLFFTKGNSYFSFNKKKIVNFNRQPAFHKIVAANKTGNIMRR